MPTKAARKRTSSFRNKPRETTVPFRKIEDICAKLGRRVRGLRIGMELTQQNFTNKAGVSRTFVVALELGTTSISIAMLEVVAMALHTTPSDLLKGL